MQPLPSPRKKCNNVGCALCPTSFLRVSKQLTLSPAAGRLGHARLSVSPKYISPGAAPRSPAAPDRRMPSRGGPGTRHSPSRGGGRAAAPLVLAGAAGCGGRRRGLCGEPGCGPAPRGAPSNQRAPAAWPGARPGRVRGSRGTRAAARRPSGFRARCLDAVAVAARAGGFPRAPAPSPAPPSARRVPTPKIASPLAAGGRRAPLPAPGLGGRGSRL